MEKIDLGKDIESKIQTLTNQPLQLELSENFNANPIEVFEYICMGKIETIFFNFRLQLLMLFYY